MRGNDIFGHILICDKYICFDRTGKFMKIFFSEHQVIYSSYTFSYGVYCLKETQDELAEIYTRGFLPYTGNLKIKKDIFYLARSVRVNLENFSDTSENRRVNRITSELGIHVDVISKNKFDAENPEFLSFCQQFAEERFDGGRMDKDRIRHIFHCGTFSHIIVFQSVEKIYGYVFAAIHGDMLHYWYSFFDIAFLKSHALGKWMMWRAIRWAKDNGLKYVYLGTCYKTKALYKVRDHNGVEFFDGVRWNNDTKLLKHLCQLDEEGSTESGDRLKSDDEKIQGLFQELFEQ